MPRQTNDDWSRAFDAYTFEERAAHHERVESWKAKGLRFLRYLSTRQIECWGFFAAGIVIAKIL